MTNMDNGSAYCVEDTGSALVEKWEWNPPEPDNQFILQGMAIADGMVYFGTDYGDLYALKEGGLCGDVNCDGYVTTADVVPVFRLAMYQEPVCSEWAADVNCDGFVTTADVVPVFRCAMYGEPLDCCTGC